MESMHFLSFFVQHIVYVWVRGAQDNKALEPGLFLLGIVISDSNHDFAISQTT